METIVCIGGCGYSWRSSDTEHVTCEDCLAERVVCRACGKAAIACSCADCACTHDRLDEAVAVLMPVGWERSY